MRSEGGEKSAHNEIFLTSDLLVSPVSSLFPFLYLCLLLLVLLLLLLVPLLLLLLYSPVLLSSSGGAGHQPIQPPYLPHCHPSNLPKKNIFLYMNKWWQDIPTLKLFRPSPLCPAFSPLKSEFPIAPLEFDGVKSPKRDIKKQQNLFNSGFNRNVSEFAESLFVLPIFV